MRVWVVYYSTYFLGEYSQSGVAGVFSSQDVAERYMAAKSEDAGDGAKFEIEETTIDVPLV